MRWETEGGRLANHETEGQLLMNTPNSIPVNEDILFVGFSDVFGDALLAEEVSFDRRQSVAEGVPV